MKSIRVLEVPVPAQGRVLVSVSMPVVVMSVRVVVALVPVRERVWEGVSLPQLEEESVSVQLVR